MAVSKIGKRHIGDSGNHLITRIFLTTPNANARIDPGRVGKFVRVHDSKMPVVKFCNSFVTQLSEPY